MPGIDLLLTNLLQPIVLAFLLGAIAGFVKSELELPEAVIKLLSIYLLFSLGITGGRELAKAEIGAVLPLVGVTVLMILAIPTAAYLIMRRLGGFDISNAAAIAAHYGSVSTATFFSAVTFATAMNTPSEGYMAAMVALMEFGVIYALVIARVAMGRSSGNGIKLGELMLSVIRGRGILLLGGGMLIGYIASDRQYTQIQPFFEGLFRGMLMLFLLEMGITAARQIKAFREVGAFMLGFGILMPIVNGLVGVALGTWAGLSVGGAFVFGAICASASFIDAPAACRASLPEANPGIYLTSSLGITLP
ncbi:MAG: sodium-dependent bicarbonate transport family permease, partial [Rubrivivax sp.]|nr:sodium-dependent bicarbonate transport family permease [Rubrivivax sp.]